MSRLDDISSPRHSFTRYDLSLLHFRPVWKPSWIPRHVLLRRLVFLKTETTRLTLCALDMDGLRNLGHPLSTHDTNKLIVIVIAQFRYIKIQSKTIELSTRLRGNKPHKLCSYSPEPRTEAYCFRLHFNIPKLVYYNFMGAGFLDNR